MLYSQELHIDPGEILCYLRKSRSDDPLSSVEEVLAKHETILDDWCDKNLGAVIPEKNKYREIVSGETIEDRPEIKKVLKLIESPKIKAVLVVEVQRLSRGDLEDAGRLIKLLRYTNTMVITPQKTYDLQDDYDRDFFERELKRGNEFLEYQKKIMNRGRLLSVQQGNYIGSIQPYGYEKIWVTEDKRKCPTLKIKEDEAEVVRMIFDMYVNQDMGCVKIAHKLDYLGIRPPTKGEHWSPEGIRCILQNVHYTGKVCWYRRKTVSVVEDGEIVKTRGRAKDYLIYDGKHEAIISDELFQAAHDKQGRNHRERPSTEIRNPFAGLLYCQCGRAMSLRTYKTQDGKERCSPRLLCDNQAICHTSSCLFDDMVERVCSVLEQCIRDFEVKIQNQNKNNADEQAKTIKRLESKMKDLEAKELSMWESQSDPNPDMRMPQNVFKMLKEKLNAEKETTKRALENAYAAVPQLTTEYYERKRANFQEALDALRDDSIPAAKKNKLLRTCIDRIEYDRQQSKRFTRDMAEPGEKLTVGGRWFSKPIDVNVKLRL